MKLDSTYLGDSTYHRWPVQLFSLFELLYYFLGDLFPL